MNAPQLTLYYAPITCSLVPYIALKEAAMEFDVRVINFHRGDHLNADFLALNPKHQVPVLVIDGQPLTENVAIQLWVARQSPAARLLPTDPMEEFRAIAFLAWCDSGIHPHLTPNVLPQRYCDIPGTEDGVRRAAQILLLEKYQLAEDFLSSRQWFFEDFSLADAFFFWCFRRGMQFQVDVSRFSACRAHFERVTQRVSVQQLLAFEQQTLDGFGRAA